MGCFLDNERFPADGAGKPVSGTAQRPLNLVNRSSSFKVIVIFVFRVSMYAVL